MLKNGYSVRDAENWEVFQLVDMVEVVLKESVTYRNAHFNKEKTANFLMDRILKRPDTFFRIIVDKDNKPVGGMMCVWELFLFGEDKVSYDVTVMIQEEHRGRCLPQLVQIIEEYKEWAIAEGVKVIKMGVSSGLKIEKAERFLEMMGFARIGSMHAVMVGE